MTGVRLTIEHSGLEAAAARLNALGGREFRHDLLEIAGATAEGGARRRIGEEKMSPEGVPWAAWSERYAATRRAGKSLLQSDGGLLDSLAHEVDPSGSHAAIGSNLVYAAIHQFGDEEASGEGGIPARPYLGLSAQDDQDLLDAVDEFIARTLR